MPRRARAARRLVVDDATYLWSVRHEHHMEGKDGRYSCAEAVVLRREGSHGSLRIRFTEGPGRYVPDGYAPSGAVGTHDAGLNLHEPGTIRALLDEALSHDWDPAASKGEVFDGWALFTGAHARRQASRES